jgi:hypothetical protein
MVGAATIAAVVNAVGDWSLPFLFGGDGAIALVPNEHLDKVKMALSHSRKTAFEEHQLNLRVGLVPHQDLIDAGAPVRIAKYRLSPDSSIAFFKGHGLTQAENWVKSGRYILDEQPPPVGFDPHQGLSCRWAPLTSERGFFMSLLVKVHERPGTNGDDFTLKLIAELSAILDLNSPEAHPVKTPALHAAKTLEAAGLEASFQPRGWRLRAYLENIGFMLFVRLLNAGWIKLKSFDMEQYKQSLAPNSDYRKFDETLRMVVDCTEDMKMKTTELLERYHKLGLVAYGVHISPTALMTCFVHDHRNKHIHFVDGGDGGYAFAARGLKAQLKENQKTATAG